jgi:tetratricopeptide (TPR) repeat protein
MLFSVWDLHVSSRRRKNNGSAATNPPATKAEQPAASKRARPALSRRRKWLFRLAAIVLAPALFFSLLEAGLRLGGYGYATHFFVGPDADGAYTSNMRFGWRFFPHSSARSPVSCIISRKPAATVRIFVLGESAAQGIPEPMFGFGRILEVLLRDRYSGVKFEVVNAAMTAINSHVVLEIARDCAAHQPDLFVVYMGNNEVVGPCGPGTVFQQWSPSLKFIRTNMWLKSTRIGQLVGNAVQYFHAKGETAASWRGLEMFLGNQVAADDPRLPAVYENFGRNLADICGVARRAGAGVILATVAVNLKDCPPFASLHQADLSPDESTKWQSLYQSGIELESGKKWPEAIAKYEAAAEIDDRYAELSFRLGRCLAASGRYDEARKRFVAARDADALRFRADTQINAAIRKVAAEQEAAGIRFVDAEQSLAGSESSVGGIPGGDLFYEHVHLTFDGNYLLARCVLDQVEAALPQLAASRGKGPILSKEQCAKLLTRTAWDECQIAKLMAAVISRPPFTNQLDNAASQAAARQRAENPGGRAATRADIEAAFENCQAALEKTPNDLQLRLRCGQLAKICNEPKVAAEQYRFILKKIPDDSVARFNLGLAEKECGRIDEAIAQFERAVEIEPGLVMGNFNLALALCSCGRTDAAIARFRKVLEVDPRFAEAHNLLGIALMGRGQGTEAIERFRKALEIEPEAALYHNNLAAALAKSGQFDDAIAHFQKALKIKPDYTEARAQLDKTLEMRAGKSAKTSP